MAAVGRAVLKPFVALLVWWALSQREAWTPTAADGLLLLLLLALMFPAKDPAGRSRLQRLSEDLVFWLALTALLLFCAWASRSLRLINLSLWLNWLWVTPLVHQACLEGLEHRPRPRAARDRPTAVVVGRGPMGVRTARALRRLPPDQRPRFLGWFEAEPPARPAGRGAKPYRLGSFESLGSFLQERGVDQVYLALDAGSWQAASALLQALQDTTASIRLVPDVLHTPLLQGRLQTLDGLPVIAVMETPFSGVDAVLKRASDLVMASVILMLIWPLMLLIALWVRLDSPGPVIFRQRRMGRNGQVIEVWKFRTMRSADEGPLVRQATRDDPRMTRAGRFLRRTSLDELPQFINVLQGRMSVVGPRPHALAHHDCWRSQVHAYMLRLKARPGITGWAQVNGYRGETETMDQLRRRVEHDLAYLQNWSLALDLQIVLRTVGLVFRDSHAW